MAQSMTAFARIEQNNQPGNLAWEIRSVNHRYLEPNIRLPEALRELEPAVRDLLRQHIARGKVECTLKYSQNSQQQSLELDLPRARQLIAAAGEISALIHNPAPLNPLEVLQWPEVIAGQQQDNKEVLQQAMQLLGQCLQDLKRHRAREG